MVEKRFKLKKKNIKVVIQKIYYYVGMIGSCFFFFSNSKLRFGNDREGRGSLSLW